jgi:hypothetical protein
MGNQMGRYQVPPPNYLAWSICNLIFCCLPLGIVALVFSVQSQSAAQRGDMAEAERTANTAKTCNMIATIGGGIAILIFFIFVLGASHAAHP